MLAAEAAKIFWQINALACFLLLPTSGQDHYYS